MSIASAIVAKQQQVASAYTAISNKGGTLPATQNLTNMPTAISSIPSGGGSQTKYGANINTILGDVNASGVLQSPTEQSDLVFTGVKDIKEYGLYFKFIRSGVKSVSFPDLENLTGSYCINGSFQNSNNLVEASFPLLESINASSVFASAFGNCANLKTINFQNLRSISYNNTYGSCFSSAFSSCTSLDEVSFPNLQEILTGNCFNNCFQFCTGLKKVYFPKLTTVSQNTAFGASTYDYIFYGCNALTEIHFNSNAQSVISNLSGYSTKWGATNATIYFDQ